jgi:CelD/BcsL family acetyltransferase involved in cellulose biosynthesis
MNTDILNGWDAVTRLSAEWPALLRASATDSVFQTWEWLTAWRAAVAADVVPHVVTVRDDAGALVGIGPFYRTTFRLARAVPVRALRVLGDLLSGGEGLGWILHRDREVEAARALAGALAGWKGWDCLWMPLLPGWTGADARVRDACADAGPGFEERECEFACVELPSDYRSYVQSLSGNTRSMLQRRTKQVMAEPGTRLVECASEEDLPEFLDALFALNDRRWRANGQIGTFVRKPGEARFYRTFAGPALRAGWLRIFGLMHRGVLSAVQVGYVYGDAFLQMQEGFDPEGPTGIGNVLRGKVVERCIADGLRHYDFLEGFTEHKRRWLAERRTGHDLQIVNRTARGMLLRIAKPWPSGRYLRPDPLPGA